MIRHLRGRADLVWDCLLVDATEISSIKIERVEHTLLVRQQPGVRAMDWQGAD
jgi:hypothetical protein